MGKNIYDIIIEPWITEKGTAQNSAGKYLFKVHRASNKQEIKEAVEKIFNVKVVGVRTLVVKGKPKRVRQEPGLTADWKKAIVTLKAGQVINLV